MSICKETASRLLGNITKMEKKMRKDGHEVGVIEFLYDKTEPRIIYSSTNLRVHDINIILKSALKFFDD